MKNMFGTNTMPYAIIYFLLIIAFSYFYATIQFDPVEIANNLKKNGGLPRLPRRQPTSEYIRKVLNKITLMGALYLSVVAVGAYPDKLPHHGSNLFGISSAAPP